jgi:transposase
MFNVIHEHEWTGYTASTICKKYGVSRKTYYKYNNRYKEKGMEALSHKLRTPHNIKYKKLTCDLILIHLAQ